MNQLSADIAEAMQGASNEVQDMARQTHVLKEILDGIRAQDQDTGKNVAA